MRENFERSYVWTMVSDLSGHWCDLPLIFGGSEVTFGIEFV